MAFVAVAIGGAAAVSLGTGIAGANAQSDAANKASEIQAQQYAETKAALNQGKTEALGYIDPYAKAGGQALNELSYGMGLQTPTAGYTSQNTQQGGLANYGQNQYSKDPAYTPMVNSLAELQATPGYQCAGRARPEAGASPTGAARNRTGREAGSGFARLLLRRRPGSAGDPGAGRECGRGDAAGRPPRGGDGPRPVRPGGPAVGAG